MTPQEARALIDVLNDYGQMDEEDIIVSVSRQAIHEAMEGLRAYANMLEREASVKVNRVDVKSAMMDYADALLTGGDPDPNGYTDRIFSAIEDERPSIEAAERERLAKVAENMALIEPEQRPVWLTHDEWRAVAGWIRSQGET